MPASKQEMDVEKIGYRFNENCKAHIWEKGAVLPPVISTNPFLLVWRYITLFPYHVYSLYGGTLGVLLLPFHMLGVLILVVFKLLLNPPGCSCIQSKLSWEFDIPISVNPDNVLGDMKKYYRLDSKRPGVQTNVGISGEFWVERLQMYTWLPFPLVMAQLGFDEAGQRIILQLPAWGPHALAGSIVIKKNPDNNCIVVCSQTLHWFGLGFVYKYIVKSVASLHHKQMLKLKESLCGTSHYDMVATWPQEVVVSSV